MRAVLRVVGVLGLCVGIGLGIVSPSNADVQVGGTTMVVNGITVTVSVVVNSGSYATGDLAVTTHLKTPAYTGSPQGNGWTIAARCDTVSTGAQAWFTIVTSGGLNSNYDQSNSVFSGYCGAGKKYGVVGFFNVNSAVAIDGTTHQLLTPPVVTWYATGAPGSPPPPAPNVAAGACVFSDTQLALVAAAQGWTGTDLTRSVAIALAESSGVVNALHHNTNESYDIGLWQINDMAHPTYDRNRLGTDPDYNAAAAHEVWSTAGSSFSPWVTYATGAYSKYLDRANDAVATIGTESAHLVNCAGGTSTGAGDQADGDPGAGCTGWSPITYFKCALRWAFVPGPSVSQQWTTFINNVQTRAPMSYAIAATRTAKQGVDFLNTDRIAACGGCADETFFSDGLPGTSPAVVQETSIWDQIAAIGEISMVTKMRAVMGFAVYVGGAWLLVHRVRASFGGKE